MYFLKKEFELTPDRVTFLNEIKSHKERKLHKEMFRKTKEQTGPLTSADIMVLEKPWIICGILKIMGHCCKALRIFFMKNAQCH